MSHARTALVAAALVLPFVAAPLASRQQEVTRGEELTEGATLRIYELAQSLDALKDLVPGQTPNIDRLVPTIDFADHTAFASDGPADQFLVEIDAQLVVEVAGVYAFRLTCDDGATLDVAGQRLLENDGLHAPTSVEGEIELAAGLHPLRVRHFEAGGGEELRLEWRAPGAAEFAVVPAAALRTKKNVVRVTSPGPKRLMGPGGPMRPGAGMPLEAVHPSFRVVKLRPDGFKPKVGGLAVLPNGDLVVATFDPNQDGWSSGIKSEPDGVLHRIANASTAKDPSEVVVSEFATGFFEPAGLLLHDGALYVAQRNEITRLADTGDGSYSQRSTFASGWTSDNYHHFTFGLAVANGNLYAALSTSIYIDDPDNVGYIGLNGPGPVNRGTLLEMPLATGEVRYVAGGFRTPDGVGVGVNGQVYVDDNQGAWKPANLLYSVKPGRFYGHYNSTQKGRLYPDGGFAGPFDAEPVSPAAVVMPQNECANSPSQILAIDRGPLMRDFAGQLLVGDVKQGGLHRVFIEEVRGEEQGCVFRFSQGFECGVHRLAWGPDGKLFVGGTGASDSWSWNDTRFGLERLDPTGKSAFEMRAVRATPDGFVIEYTREVAREQLADTAKYIVQQWRYEPTPEYGGDKLDLERLEVALATPSADGRSVRLVIPSLKEGRVVHLYADHVDTSGEQIWTPETWYTLNQRPRDERSADNNGADVQRALVFSRTEGFRHGSIGTGRRCFDELAREHGFEVRFTEDPSWFDAATLSAYDAVVFLNTTGDVLDDDQQAALEAFVEAGGGFLGVHSAADTEYDWPWYGKLVGAWFAGHPHIQQALVRVKDAAHPATADLPKEWRRVDEWYDYRAPVDPDVRVLLALDQSSYEGSQMPAGQHAIAWCHERFGGRALYTGGGHTDEAYAEPLFRQHLVRALGWVAKWTE
jgi:type 1 glutamine amidotransferase/glucose/arabinose dehydrogenase